MPFPNNYTNQTPEVYPCDSLPVLCVLSSLNNSNSSIKDSSNLASIYSLHPEYS